MALISNQKTWKYKYHGKYTVKVVDERKIKTHLYVALWETHFRQKKNIQTEGVVVEKVIIRKESKRKLGNYA